MKSFGIVVKELKLLQASVLLPVLLVSCAQPAPIARRSQRVVSSPPIEDTGATESSTDAPVAVDRATELRQEIRELDRKMRAAKQRANAALDESNDYQRNSNNIASTPITGGFGRDLFHNWAMKSAQEGVDAASEYRELREERDSLQQELETLEAQR